MRRSLTSLVSSLAVALPAAAGYGQTFDGIIPSDEAVADAALLPPLLLEGTGLVAAPGTMRRDAASGAWRFLIDADDQRLAGYELILLPCDQLSDMENVLDTSGNRPVRFELTGEIFAYRDRNFVLPGYAPHRVLETPEPAAADDPGDGEDAPSGGDTVDDIIRNLEQAVGPLVRDPGRAAAADGDPGSGSRSFLIWRRGRVVRSEGGGWLFVFDADAEGLADPPAVLLPCRTLETIESYALRKGGDAHVVLSGRIFSYRGTRYVLPTLFVEPRERSKLTP